MEEIKRIEGTHTRGSMNTMTSSRGTWRRGSGTKERSTRSVRGREAGGWGATLSSSATIFNFGHRERSPSTRITCALVSACVRASKTPFSVYPLERQLEGRERQGKKRRGERTEREERGRLGTLFLRHFLHFGHVQRSHSTRITCALIATTPFSVYPLERRLEGRESKGERKEAVESSSPSREEPIHCALVSAYVRA
jgi:hypothetical protein